MVMYVFDYYQDKTGFGICDLYIDREDAVKDAKDYYSRLTAREKKLVNYCHVYEVEVTAEQAEAIEAGENPEPYWTADVWDALEEETQEDGMKRYFVETQDYNFVAFVDAAGKAVVVDEDVFPEPLTLEVAKRTDYESLEGFETAEEAAANYGTGSQLIDFNPDDYERVTEF